jgi:hypothetical protein
VSERKSIELELGGMWAAGDAGRIPPGYVRTMTNMLQRPGPRWVKRPAALAEAAAISTGFVGFLNWEDTTNQVVRLGALVTNGANTDLYLKATSGETYGAPITGANVLGSPASFTNYRGVLYWTMGSGSPATPLGLFSYNGTTVNTAPIGGESLFSLTIAAFIDRLFLGYVQASVVNQLGTSVMYDPTAWSNVTTTTTNITNGSTVIGRITPTATTLSQIYKKDVYTVAASTTDTTLVLRSDMRNTSPTYEMPMTVEVYYSQAWVTLTTYAVGAIRVPTSATGNGSRFRVTVAGTSAAGEPAWPATVGGIVVDGGTLTWINDGPDAIASTPTTLPTLSAKSDFIATWAVATIPPNPAASNVGVRLKFGTTATATITLAPIDISFKDGLAGGVLTKVNKGQQLTAGKFKQPFVNTESSATATITLDNDIYWTETLDVNTIRGNNYQKLREAPGRVSAMVVIGGRLIVFKRRGMWVFQGTADPDIPIILERYFANVGCVGPGAWTVFEDTLYFIGEQEIYGYAPGGQPVAICGPAVREDVIGSAASAVGVRQLEIITGNLTPSLCVDTIHRDLFVPSSLGMYGYSLDAKPSYATAYAATSSRLSVPAWSLHTIVRSGLPHNYVIANLIFNATTGNVYGAAYSPGGTVGTPFYFNFGSPSVDVDTVLSALSSQTATIQFKPIEPETGRADLMLDEIGVWAGAGAVAGNNIFTTTITRPSDGTFSKTNIVSLPTGVAGDVRTVVPVRQNGSDLTVQFTHVGSCGRDAFVITRAEAVVRQLRPERTRTTPTQGAASL